MSVMVVGKLLNGLAYKCNTGYNLHPDNLLQVRNYAARKSTRERKRKELLKRKPKVKPVEKVGYVGGAKTKKTLSETVESVNLRFDDSHKTVATDDVWIAKQFRSKIYSFEEAVQSFKDVLHPSMFNVPNAYLNAVVELNMQGRKKTRFISTFTHIVPMPHIFSTTKENSVVAFCKSVELQQKALDAGASLVAGPEIISKILTGKISLNDYQAIVAHPNILPDLVVIRGILKRRFPNPNTGTLSYDIADIVKRFVYGIEYTATQHATQKDFGLAKVVIGKLDMDAKHIEENFVALLKDLEYVKAIPKSPFVTRTTLECPPSKESFTVDHNIYLAESDTSGAAGSTAQDDEYNETTSETEAVQNN